MAECRNMIKHYGYALRLAMRCLRCEGAICKEVVDCFYGTDKYKARGICTALAVLEKLKEDLHERLQRKTNQGSDE